MQQQTPPLQIEQVTIKTKLFRSRAVSGRGVASADGFMRRQIGFRQTSMESGAILNACARLIHLRYWAAGIHQADVTRRVIFGRSCEDCGPVDVGFTPIAPKLDPGWGACRCRRGEFRNFTGGRFPLRLRFLCRKGNFLRNFNRIRFFVSWSKFLFRFSEDCALLSPFRLTRGAFRDRHERWVENAVDAVTLPDGQCERVSAKACGPDAPGLVSSLRDFSQATVTK